MADLVKEGYKKSDILKAIQQHKKTSELDRMVKSGKSPAEASDLVAGQQQMIDRLNLPGAQKPRGSRRAAPDTAPAPPAAATDATGFVKPKLTAAESKEFGRFLRMGKTEEEAFQMIAQLRSIQDRLNLRTPESIRQAVAERNASGRWPE